jgi:hypothetical protein
LALCVQDITKPIHLSSKNGDIARYLLTDTNENKEHFSFVQEKEELSVSYLTLIQSMSKKTNNVQMRNTEQVALNTDNAPKGVREAGTRQATMSDKDYNDSFVRQICIWLPITLGLVLYFVIYALMDMPFQKNSILYAKYGTTKPMQGNQ